MTKKQLRLNAFNFLGSFGENIRTKFDNICGKTGQYDVPSELFQKRTNRKNRVLMPWKAVKRNNFTIQQLSSFTGGVVVELINEDFFDPSNQTDPVFIELKNRLGGNDIVSSMISIRSESGSSSSKVQRDNFNQLINNTKVIHEGSVVTINESNYRNYAIKRNSAGGVGNHTWSGFIFVSIRGGQQDTIETHRGQEELLFNPSCEFANEDVCLDLDLVVAYFALNSIDNRALSKTKQETLGNIMLEIKDALRTANYSSTSYTGNLLDYCDNHPSLRLYPGKLFDPIQVQEINIEDFGIKDKEDSRNLDFTHDEAVNIGSYYWDTIHKCILSPARPANIFWSKHLSNMMQQNFSLQDYFKHEAEISKRRKELLEKNQ